MTLPPPQPVYPGWFGRWDEYVQELSAGERASPVFRDPWSDMNTRLALSAQMEEAVPLDPALEARYRELSAVAALMGAQRVLTDMVSEAPLLDAARGTLQMAVAPAISISKGGAVKPYLQPTFNAQEQARVSQPQHRMKAPPPSLRLGMGTTLVSPWAGDSAEEPFHLTWNAWIQGNRFGPDAFRLQVNVITRDFGVPLGQAYSLEPGWSGQMRHELRPGVALQADLRSLPRDWRVDTARAGVAWEVQEDTWLRLSYTHTPWDDEHRVDLRVFTTAAWPMPRMDNRVGQPWWE